MILIIMGVSGVGKSTIGRRLAEELAWEYYDADDFHSPSSVEKMARGVALTDEDRKPWLANLRALIENCRRRRQEAVIACSALKEKYRSALKQSDADVRFIFLKGDYELIRRRMLERTGHFMNADLLRSQFATLEVPEGALTVDVSPTPEAIVREIRQQIGR